MIQQRITTASQLLQFTNYTIKQIAEKMGCSSVNFFSRQFHQITGHTPGEVKELAHGGRVLK